MKRRAFIKLGSLALFTACSSLTAAAASGESSERSVSSDGTLVVVSLRGGLDGLHALIPYRSAEYYRARPNLAVSRAVLELDAEFALHPALRPLSGYFEQGILAPVCAIGTGDRSRSHFLAQDYLDFGGPEEKSGWLNRYLRAGDLAVFSKAHRPGLLRGPNSVMCVSEFEARDRVRTGSYPATSLARQLKAVAHLLKQGVSLRAAHCELSGFDTHVCRADSLGPDGPHVLNRLLGEFAGAVDAFWRDLGERSERVTLLTVTEFGRRVAENDSLGTDHGLASVSFVMGRGVRGGRVYGRWPGLRHEQLVDGVDLAVTSDYRQLLNEYTERFAGDKLFPGFRGARIGCFG